MIDLRFSRFVEAMDRLAFSWKVRETLYRHLSVQIGNGIPVETALDAFHRRLLRNRRKSTAAVVGTVARRMRDGETFAAAIAQWIPRDEASMIAGGEMAGRLPFTLDLIIESTRRTQRVSMAIRSALVTPAVYLAAMYVVVWAIGRFVTPSLMQVLPPEKATGLIHGLYVSGDLANSWWALLPLLVAAALSAAVSLSLPRWTGRARILAERYFPYSFYRDIRGYGWLLSFTALLQAGVPDTEILKRQWATASPWLLERLQEIWRRMDNGAGLAEALLAPGNNRLPFGFPNPDIVDEIDSMAGFSDFSDRIVRLAAQWAGELEQTMLAKVKATGVVMELFMYGMMGLLMVAINSMSVQIGSVPGM
jgi:type II secretory pathway component PulF